MNRLLVALILSVSTLALSSSVQALRVEPTFIMASSPQKVYFGSTYFYCYPNNLLVPANHVYNRSTIRNMALLSRHLGWNHVYVLSPKHQYGMPYKYRHYAQQYFGHHGIRYQYYYPSSRNYNSHYYQQPSTRYYQQPSRRYYEPYRYHRGSRYYGGGGSSFTFRFNF